VHLVNLVNLVNSVHLVYSVNSVNLVNLEHLENSLTPNPNYMFTGIVQACVPITSCQDKPGLKTFSLHLPETLDKNVKLGASIAIDGVCLTVAKKQGQKVIFNAMQETLQKTTIGLLKKGQTVNLERSARFGDEIGGHVVSGHVTGMAKIIHVETPENNQIVTFKVPKAWMKYILPKGFIALDGCSLTIVDVKKSAGTFTVWFIPETLKRTVFGRKQVGDMVNVEIDSRTQAIVDTVEQYMNEKK